MKFYSIHDRRYVSGLKNGLVIECRVAYPIYSQALADVQRLEMNRQETEIADRFGTRDMYLIENPRVQADNYTAAITGEDQRATSKLCKAMGVQS
jgi:hypothetical protein